MTEPLVYLAGPLFSDQDREMLLRIESAFRASGMRCFLPHREVGDLSPLKTTLGEELARQYVFDSDIKGVTDCSVLCALLDGPDVDSGTAAEMGFAHALAKPVFGLCTDSLRRGRTINNMIWGVCDGGRTIYSCLDEMIKAVVDVLVRNRQLTESPVIESKSSPHSSPRGPIRRAGCE